MKQGGLYVYFICIIDGSEYNWTLIITLKGQVWLAIVGKSGKAELAGREMGTLG